MKELTLIGHAERVGFPDLGIASIPAKIDTGADASSIWATATADENGHLSVVFLGPDSPLYDGQVHTFPKSSYSKSRVSNSFGHWEVRYKLKLKIRVNGRIINSSFTLADRSTKLYPILLGRSLLRNKFLVDVSKGIRLAPEKTTRKRKLQKVTNIMSEVQ